MSPLYKGKTVSVLNNDKSLWLPAKVICKADQGFYLVQVIGGGQYRCASDHIHEHHPDAVKPGTSITTDVAPATPEPLPALPVAKPPAAHAVPVVPATPPQQAACAATTNTPHKPPPAMPTPQQQQMPSTGCTPKQTSATPTAPHLSAHVSKPTYFLVEEIDLDQPPVSQQMN